MSIATPRRRYRSGWIMFSALLLSLLLHAGLFFVPQIHLTLFPVKEPKGVDADLVTLLKVRIAAPEPVVPAPPAPKAKPKPKPKQPVKTVGPALAAPDVPPPVIPDAPEPPDEATPAGPIGDDTTAADTAPLAEQDAVVPYQAAPAAVEPVPDAETKTDTTPQPPLKLIVNYALYKGKNGIKIGKIVHTWDIKDGHYVIASVVEAAGLARLLTSEMIIQTSQGRITANGLEPESYWEQRGQKADRTFRAEFDYLNKTLTYGRVEESTTVPLPPGTQDQLSFIYQFGLKAPLSGTVHFSMTTGRKLGSYASEVVGEEVIESGLGELRTQHLKKVLDDPRDDQIEIWLATDHQYLPVKVRITNSDGDVLEQLVEGIRKE